jgi:hypothetical protein
MTTVKFDISEAEELARYLGISIEKVALRAIHATALRVVQHITTVIIPAEPNPPVDRSIYRAGWRAHKAIDGAVVTNHVPYASIIEFGARAENIKISRAMIIALTGWVMRKGIVKPAGRGKKAKAAAHIEATRAAWAIAMAMKKRGIFNQGKGLRVLEKALKIVQNAFAQELRTEIEREY